MSAASRTRPSPLAAGRRTPTASVVVPCYNYGHYLAACVASCLDQPGVDVDVIIVDDASPDGSGRVARELADRSGGKVRALLHERNKGHIATYNDGLELVVADYVVLLSADDLLVPGSLTRAVALMETHPSVGLVYGHPQVFEDVPPRPRTTARSWTVWSGADWIAAQSRRGTSCIYSPEAVVRTRVQHAIGYYEPELPHTGDLSMWLRVAAVADVGRVNGADQALRREHPASMMATTFAGGMVDLEGRLEAFDRFFDGPGAQLPGQQRCRRLAHERLADQALDLACTELAAGAEPGQVADYEAFARKVATAVELLPRWREYRWRASGPGGALAGVRGRGYALRRDLAGRLRWRRWHWSGV